VKMRDLSACKKGNLAAVTFGVMLIMSTLGVKLVKASSPFEWTQNSTFNLNGHNDKPE